MASKQLEHPALDQLSATPEILRLLMSGVTETEAQPRPDPARWSIAEVLEHLSHVEGHVFRTRIDRMKKEANPALEGYDQEAHAAAGMYSNRDAEESFAHWEEQRDSNLGLLRTLEPSSLSRTGVHAEVGLITIGEVLNQWASHDLGHVRQIANLVRIAKFLPRIGPFRKYYPA